MLAAGDQAPEFALRTLSGGITSLRDLTGSGPVLLAFFKASCPVCQYTFPFLERLTAAQGFRIVGISQDDPEETADFRRTSGVSFPMVLDDAGANYPASNAYGITHVPSLFLVEGTTVTLAVTGFSRSDLEGIGGRFGAVVFHEGEKTGEFRPG